MFDRPLITRPVHLGSLEIRKDLIVEGDFIIKKDVHVIGKIKEYNPLQIASSLSLTSIPHDENCYILLDNNRLEFDDGLRINNHKIVLEEDLNQAYNEIADFKTVIENKLQTANDLINTKQNITDDLKLSLLSSFRIVADYTTSKTVACDNLLIDKVLLKFDKGLKISGDTLEIKDLLYFSPQNSYIQTNSFNLNADIIYSQANKSIIIQPEIIAQKITSKTIKTNDLRVDIGVVTTLRSEKIYSTVIETDKLTLKNIETDITTKDIKANNIQAETVKAKLQGDGTDIKKLGKGEENCLQINKNGEIVGSDVFVKDGLIARKIINNSLQSDKIDTKEIKTDAIYFNNKNNSISVKDGNLTFCDENNSEYSFSEFISKLDLLEIKDNYVTFPQEYGIKADRVNFKQLNGEGYITRGFNYEKVKKDKVLDKIDCEKYHYAEWEILLNSMEYYKIKAIWNGDKIKQNIEKFGLFETDDEPFLVEIKDNHVVLLNSINIGVVKIKRTIF